MFEKSCIYIPCYNVLVSSPAPAAGRLADCDRVVALSARLPYRIVVAGVSNVHCPDFSSNRSKVCHLSKNLNWCY